MKYEYKTTLISSTYTKTYTHARVARSLNACSCCTPHLPPTHTHDNDKYVIDTLILLTVDLDIYVVTSDTTV